MELEIHGHACASVRHASRRLVVDPWLCGSVYWGSWWHWPEPVFDEDVLHADWVYITHWHFDHLHRETLERFDRGCHFLVPKFPVSFLVQQLRELGFERVTELVHGRPFELGPGFRLTSFQIQYQDDSLCVVEAGEQVLVDLNDSKPLRRTWHAIKRRFPAVDFMLRSHSPAWSYPTAFSFEDPSEAIPVDRASYMQAFRSAAEFLAPRYAVPFASMVCHLHPESLAENEHVIGARELERYFASDPLAGTELVVMPPGSRWTPAGFELTDDTGTRDVHAYVESKRREKREELAALAARDDARTLRFEDFEAFFRRLLRRLLPLRPFLGIRWVFEVSAGDGLEYWTVDVRRGTVRRAQEPPARYTSRMEVHPGVLADALAQTVFTNIDISKRWRVHVRRGGLQKHLLMWVLVSLFEAGYLELGNLFRWRFAACVARRRAEIPDYLALARALLRKDRGAAAEAVTHPV